MRNVLITGCSTGIGYCVATGLKARGYQVYATARQTKDVERLEKEGFRTIQLDLANSESVNDAVNELMLRTNSELFAVFHNGAYGQIGAVEDISRTTMEQQFATNVFGWIELNNRLMPLFRQRNEGRIIFNSSILGFISFPFRGTYAASKYAIEGFADTMRLELSNTNISVSLIQPGPIDSRFRANALIAFEKNVDTDSSVFHLQYKAQKQRLEKKDAVMRFTLPPKAVLKKVIHALESRHPKARYHVTVPTHVMAILKRLLPTKWLDRFLNNI